MNGEKQVVIFGTEQVVEVHVHVWGQFCSTGRLSIRTTEDRKSVV